MRIITAADHNTAKILSLIAPKEESQKDVEDTVKTIIYDVRTHGDTALLAYTNKLDWNELKLEELKVTPAELDEAYNSAAPELVKSMELSYKRIEEYYTRIKPMDLQYTDELGVTLGARYVPIDSAGLYVPGGKASYPSSVLMNAVPAIVAGVPRIAMVCPAGSGSLNPAVLAAAKICGITEIYKIGGAQAIAALAYGTKLVPKVDKIVGPGNAYVAEAKRQVFGTVGIDMIAGPSEILVIADENNNPDWIAADLLSQAEHDESARPFLITNSQNFAQKVIASVYEFLTQLERKDIARKSIEENGLVIVVSNWPEAVELCNKIAPEHLELAVSEPKEILPHINNAGAIFLGRYTPEAIGDYIAGPSHVLPTATSARYSSGLSVTDFMKRQSIIDCSEESFRALADPTIIMAKAEGLSAHALSVSIRLEKNGN